MLESRPPKHDITLMKHPARKRVLGLSLLRGALALTMIAILTSPKPIEHQGKTVRQWVSLLDPHVEHQRQREEASWALVQIGAPALPELKPILAWRPNVLETIRNYGVRFGIVKPREIHPLELQSRACEAAYDLAERATVDISALVPQLRYHFTNGTYADVSSGRALADAGPNGVPVLTNLLLIGGRTVRDDAGAALGHVGRKREVIEALIRSANTDPDPMLRANAVLYLSHSGGPPQQLVPLGLRFFKAEDAYQRWAAASLLLEYQTIPEVRAALAAGLSDPDQRVRSVSQRALEEPAANRINRR